MCSNLWLDLGLEDPQGHPMKVLALVFALDDKILALALALAPDVLALALKNFHVLGLGLGLQKKVLALALVTRLGRTRS